VTETPIDAATVQRCIEALKGSGEYRRDWKRRPYHPGPGELVETWTYTTHPMDILAALLHPPEKSEAEKLVAEWLDTSDVNDSYRELVQFILDKQKAHLKELIAPSDMPVVEKPQYVFGPWVTPTDELTPNFPIGWLYQMRSSRTLEVNSVLWKMGSRVCSIDTDYRAVFEVGKWYNWNGGPCPVEPDTKVHIQTRDGYQDTDGEAASGFGPTEVGRADWWAYQNCRTDDHIVRFKIIGEAA